MRPPAVALLLLALVPACTTQTTSSPVRMLEVKASLDTLWTRYAFASDAHDAGGFALLFADDATLAFTETPTLHGPAAIGAFLGKLYSGSDVTALRINQQDLVVAGPYAFQSGVFEEDVADGGSAKTEYGRFSMIAEQDKNRAWRIRHFTEFTDSIRP